jgi:alkylation response protein AidB-like acyl-CoA dehydrogenase
VRELNEEKTMISFEPTEEQVSAQEAMRSFATDVLRPAARECDEASAIPEAFLAQAWELGLTPTQLPEAYGGYGAERSPLTNAIVLEELAYGDATLALAALAPSLFANAIADQGSDEQKRQYLPAFCGEKFHTGSLALAEPTPGFDAFSPQTTAESKGAGFALHGQKCFVPMADQANHLLVVARRQSGLGAFIVPRDAAGLTISETEKNMGLRALPTFSVRFDGVAVEAANQLGESSGADVARIINQSRVAIAAALTGLSRAVLDYCVPYAKERVAFDEPIARKQSIAFRLAEMHMEIESCRWLTWRAASDLEAGRDATRNTTLAKNYAARKATWIADNGVQVLGGHGFIREHPVEMWYRNARTLSVLEGTVSV